MEQQTRRHGPTVFLLAIVASLALVTGGGCGSDSNGRARTGGGDAGPVGDGTGGDVTDFDGIGGEDGGGGGPACEENRDCGGGELCVEGRCRAACFDDSDCTGSTPACDPASRLCVECADDGDCGDGESCRGGACRFFCRSNGDCGGGEFCDTVSGACLPVECTANADCGGGEICDTDRFVCVEVECVANRDCAGGELCRDFRCVPAGTECSPGDSECLDEATGRECDADGTWVSFACGDSPCVDGECRTGGELCTPSRRWCEAGAVRICNADGSDFEEITCSTSQRCVDGVCRNPLCEPSSTFCVDLRTVGLCSTDGFDLEERPCRDGQECRSGRCRDADTNACGGDSALSHDPGEACGDCGEYVCATRESVSCDDPGFNACGGCGTLSSTPGAACGADGIWRCDGDDVRCIEGATCATDEECQEEAEALGAVRPGEARCDVEIGCYMVGRCALDGPDEIDPWDAPCPSGTTCQTSILPFPTADPVCTGCSMDDPDSCRPGESCLDLGFGTGGTCWGAGGLPFP